MKDLINKINTKKSKVGVIGLGYVGLELLLCINESKFEVFGFDVNGLKIKKLKKNIPTINTITKKRLIKIKKNNLFDGKNINKIHECDIIIICVPTPLTKKDKPDMSYIERSLSSIFKYLRPEQMIILESTVYPGATREIFFNKIKKNKKLSIGKNFYLCFSPERISPGKDYDIKYTEITKVISGYSSKCVKTINSFYKKIFKTVYAAKSLEDAEFTKLFENCYRSVNIGLVNEMKIICDKLGLKIMDIIDTAKTKPFGFRPFAPGPGVGGHCIPIDPLFISWIANRHGVTSKFIDISRKTNLKITNWILKKIKNKITKKKAKLLFVGVAYKKNVDDCRESPAIQMMEKLDKDQFNISYYDPYIENINLNKKTLFSLNKLNFKQFKNYEAVIITTDHSKINYKLILKNSKIIFDTRGVYKDSNQSKIIHC
jgi:UDP-N-acetyl-D-glucosamine dehydrogenase